MAAGFASLEIFASNENPALVRIAPIAASLGHLRGRLRRCQFPVGT